MNTSSRRSEALGSRRGVEAGRHVVAEASDPLRLAPPLRLPDCRHLVRALRAHLEDYRRAREAGARSVQENGRLEETEDGSGREMDECYHDPELTRDGRMDSRRRWLARRRAPAAAVSRRPGPSSSANFSPCRESQRSIHIIDIQNDIYTFLHAEPAIWFWHIAIDFVTLSLGLNRGSHYELVHTCLTKRTTVWLGSYNRQRAFNFGRVFSIVKVECPLSIIWPKSNCGALYHSSVHLLKKSAPFPD